ncbi:MAG: hypothetical protein M3347_00130 [Armatimonadota bacterium]|nr:hypothetical protein [Armatimonadota bacterium]
MIDEPLIVPLSPGAALVRLAQVKGAIQRHAAVTPLFAPDAPARLQKTRDDLLAMLEADDRAGVEGALRIAQNDLRQLYETLCQEATATADAFTALGFPPPRQGLQPVDVSTVIATFSMPVRQVLTTLSFQDAGGATAYWLREVRTLHGQPIEDPIVENYAPIFMRLRLSIGPHIFRIESRNAGEFTISDQFTIEVPSL